MQDKEVISRKIIEDASLQAEGIILRATQSAEQTVAQALARSEEEISIAKQIAFKEGEMLIERRKTLARLDAKKVALNCKQELINEVFEVAKQKLLAMPRDEYLSFVQKQIEQYANEGDCLLLCNSAPISCQDVLELEVVKTKKLTAKKDQNFGGGIKLLGNKTDMDLSFNAVIKAFSEEHSQEVSALLFK